MVVGAGYSRFFNKARSDVISMQWERCVGRERVVENGWQYCSWHDGCRGLDRECLPARQRVRCLRVGLITVYMPFLYASLSNPRHTRTDPSPRTHPVSIPKDELTIEFYAMATDPWQLWCVRVCGVSSSPDALPP